MALKIGNNAVANAFVGSSQVRRAYKGGTLVFQAFSPASEQEFIEQTAAGGPAEVLKCYGKSEIWRQSFKNYSTAVTSNDVTITPDADGYLTFTGTASADITLYLNGALAGGLLTNGHKVFTGLSVAGGSLTGRADMNITASSGGGSYSIDTAANFIVSVNASGNSYPRIFIASATAFSSLKIRIVNIDLTLLYGAGNEPTTVAQFEADYPTYNPAYNAGEVQSNKTAELRAERVPVINLYGGEFEFGNIDATGNPSGTTPNYMRTNSFTPVSPNTTYYLNYIAAERTSKQVYILWYNADYNIISRIQVISGAYAAPSISPSSARYMKSFVYSAQAYTDAELQALKFCFNLSDPAINGTYYPHWRGTLALNLSTLTSGGVVVFPDGMRGVGDIRDEAYGSTGVVMLGKRAYQAGDESDTSVLTDGTNTIYPLATPLTYTLDTPLPTDLTCEQGDILERVSDNNCPFVGEMRFGL